MDTISLAIEESSALTGDNHEHNERVHLDQ